MINKDFAPIILFVYNRPTHLEKTLKSLIKCKGFRDSFIYIFSDGPKTVSDHNDVVLVREVIQKCLKNYSYEIIIRKENIGLANSVINGVTSVINKHGSAIILEDDLILSPFFLSFMNKCLLKYEKSPEIFSISGFSYPIKIPYFYKYPVYISYRPTSWGWATWADRWNKGDWDINNFQEFMDSPNMQREFNRGGDDLTQMLVNQKKGIIDSWAIRWCFTHYKYNGFSLFPVRSEVQNSGHDGSGVHCGKTKKFNVILNTREILDLPNNLELNSIIISRFHDFFSPKKNLKDKFNLIISRLVKKWK